MAGWDNDIMNSRGARIERSTTDDARIMQKKTDGISMINSDGTPEAAFSANPGSICFDRTNGDLYKKSSGTGNTGWEMIEAGTDVPTTFSSDSGSTSPIGNILSILGGTGVDTVAGAGIITINASSSVATTYTTDSGNATPAANILDVTGSHGLNTDGSGNILDIQIDNAILLGDLSALGAGVPALTLTTGDLSILSGNINTPATASANVGVYEVNDIRFMHSYGTENVFLGDRAGNFTLTSTDSVGIGKFALTATTSALANTCIGSDSGKGITSGGFNTSVGWQTLFGAAGASNVAVGQIALKAQTGSQATAVGAGALSKTVSAVELCAVGFQALLNSTGSYNCAFGWNSLGANVGGTNSTGLGSKSLISVTEGDWNLACGYESGSNLTLTDSDNILLGSDGVTGDNNTIRIGLQGSGTAAQDKCFIAGITGITVAGNEKFVVLDTSTGELGQASIEPITFSWTAVSGTSDTMVASNGYVTENAGLTTLTLPASCTLGDEMKVVCKGAGLVKIAQNASQTIRFAGTTSTSGVGGSITATSIGDCVTIVCTASNEFFVTSSIGSWTIV